MKLILALLLLAACSTPQQRMKDCNVEAGDLRGEARQAFMSACLRNPGV